MRNTPVVAKSGKRFQRRVEDFVCEQCGESVQGDGFTNHCPHCLWSKHVDVFPGDRAATCGGLMAPIGLERKGDVWKIVHRCTICGYMKRNKKEAGDSFDEIVTLMKRGTR